jgi:hypothetical protein
MAKFSQTRQARRRFPISSVGGVFEKAVKDFAVAGQRPAQGLPIGVFAEGAIGALQRGAGPSVMSGQVAGLLGGVNAVGEAHPA